MKTLNMTAELYDYVCKHSPLPHPELAAVAVNSLQQQFPQMQSAPDQAAFMHVLAKLIGAKRCLEVGCFTGYSAIAVGSALPADGLLVAIDNDPRVATVANQHIAQARLAQKIEVRIGAAVDVLAALEREYGLGSFDMAFIDADKRSYDEYYEACLRLVRRGGVILVDNVLWSGQVISQADVSESTLALRALNEKIVADERVDKAMLHISDGLYVLYKR